VPEFLFTSDHIDDDLRTRPSLAAALPLPAAEGAPSLAFPHMRKSRREIYRLLANTHYEHLVETLDVFETAHAAGCTFGSLLSTTSRQQFVSLTAEVLVAEHLLSRGYSVTTIPRTDSPSPDLHVTGDGVDMAIEIYTPRQWLDIDTWMDALVDFLKNVDVPSNYRGGAHTRVSPNVGPGWVKTPSEIASMLQKTHATVFAAATADVLAALGAQQPMEKTYQHHGTDLETTVTLEQVRDSRHEGLSRLIAFSPPGYIAYSPAGVFAEVVAKASKKARRGQAHASPAATRGLLINLMSSSFAEDLLRAPYTGEAERVLAGVDPRDFGLDLMAYCVRAMPRGVAAIFSVYENTRLSESRLVAMLGSEAARQSPGGVP